MSRAHTLPAARPRGGSARPSARAGRRAVGPAASRAAERCLVLALLAVLLFPGGAAAAEAVPVDEAQLKAAFLIQFTRFVEWPAEAFAGAAAPVSFCVIGDEAVARNLEQMAPGKTVGNRPLAVKRLRAHDVTTGCHLLFIGAAERGGLAEILAYVSGSTLTVGDAPGFARGDGMIALVMEENKLRFEINQRAAEGAGLRISSRLLALAQVVYPVAR